jgi:hypothetical protein
LKRLSGSGSVDDSVTIRLVDPVIITSPASPTAVELALISGLTSGFVAGLVAKLSSSIQGTLLIA